MTTLTARESLLLIFIRDFIAKNKYSPSHRQMAANLGYKAVRSAQQLLEQLEKKGYIAHTPGISRSLQILSKRQAVRLPSQMGLA